MRASLRKKIRNKLKGYRISLNQPDHSLPVRVESNKRVAVIGGGIAGISATANLAERGFQVTLFEKEQYLGGKVGAWTFDSHGETLQVEHGFHAFFRQYHNLRGFMKKIGAYDNLIPIDDYVILFENGGKQGFKNLDVTPGLNVLDMRRHGVFNYFTFINPLSIPFIHLLRYDRENTFRKFDKESFESFARRTLMPKKMRLVFNSFARAFFSDPGKMSMAELIKGFHFYFLSNEDGLLYDVLDDDFKVSFLDHCEKFILENGGTIHTGTPVISLEKETAGFLVNGERYDYCVLTTDVKHIGPLVKNSLSLQQYPVFSRQISSLKPSDRYAVYRIWTDRFEKQALPFFVFTDRKECLDSVTLYHKMEKGSALWSNANQGGIFELHSYALPDHLMEDAAVKKQLLEELFHYFPELNGMTIRHEYFQHRQDFPAFHTGLYEERPAIKTEVPGLLLAGDWVKMENCSMLMEAAYTSGAIAANEIFKLEGIRENELESVPLKGLLT